MEEKRRRDKAREREREKIEGDQREEERREEIREHAPEGQDHLRAKLDSRQAIVKTNVDCISTHID